jgi:rSAM/selenodomain-associated transferase 1
MNKLSAACDRLILFTRYPKPGKAKTRLISVLGQDGSADLHRQLTEHMVEQVRQLQICYPVEVTVQFTGGNREQMQAWLGSDLEYQLQEGADLGDRMAHAFKQAFQTSDAVIVIGTDCPELTGQLLQQAFQMLRQHDLVLGPALDGGYYLIGLRWLVPELFQEIDWSTATVLQRTVEIAELLGLNIARLPLLSDIDLPEDLPIWERVQAKLY